MKYNKLYHMVAALLLVVMLLVLTACGSEPRQPQITDETAVTGPEEIGEIYLYGEYHANEHLLQKELALWKDCYARGVRYLFVELPYYTAQYLNLWMQAEDDTILISPRNLNSGVKLNWTTHEIVWILANPEVFKGTKYEKYVLTPDSDFLWHYRQHTVYQIDTDLDGNPDTVEITMFDNHRNPEADYYDHEKGSFVTVYAVNEKEKTVSLLKKLPVVKANVTSNTCLLYTSPSPRD